MPKEVIRDVAKQLFHEVIDEMSVQLSTGAVHASHMFMLQAEFVCSELINDLVSHLVRSRLLLISLSIALLAVMQQITGY